MIDLKEKLRVKGITQQEVADILKRDRSHINKVLNGKVKISKSIQKGIDEILKD
jgi:plasmid maintenance system antidote protein VapI